MHCVALLSLSFFWLPREPSNQLFRVFRLKDYLYWTQRRFSLWRRERYMARIGRLFVEKEDYSIAIHRSPQDGSCRGTDSITLQNHPKSLQRGLVPPFHDYLSAPMVQMSNPDFTSKNVRHGLPNPLRVLSGTDFRFAVNSDSC